MTRAGDTAHRCEAAEERVHPWWPEASVAARWGMSKLEFTEVGRAWLGGKCTGGYATYELRNGQPEPHMIVLEVPHRRSLSDADGDGFESDTPTASAANLHASPSFADSQTVDGAGITNEVGARKAYGRLRALAGVFMLGKWNCCSTASVCHRLCLCCHCVA